MKSSAKHHFPQFRFTAKTKWLFNPVLKKRFANRPEERVRLQYVDYLLHQTRFSKNRIGFEAPVELHSAENKLRADLVLYTKKMEPFALIECKSEKIRLTDKTAEQIARYNQYLKASFVMITNSEEEMWYNLDGKLPTISANPLEQLKTTNEEWRDPDYWIHRGFINPNSTQKAMETAHALLLQLFSTYAGNPIQYLNIPTYIASVHLDHYYVIFSPRPEMKLAVSVLNSGKKSTLLTAALNKDGENHGILMIDMDALTSPGNPEAELISKNGRATHRIPGEIQQILINNVEKISQKIWEELLTFFD